MKFNVGDVVDFIDSTKGSIHRGVIINHIPGRDTRSKEIGRPLREYVIKFDKPWYNYDSALVAAEDLTMIRKSSTNPTITYTSSTWTNKPLNDKDNITVTSSSIINKSTVSQGNAGGNGAGTKDIPDYPWSPYYVTSDDFFDILKVAFEDTYGSDHRWHPEDLYVNVSCVLEVVSNTLANMVRIKAGKELSGVKEA